MADVVPISSAIRTARESLLTANLEAHNKGDVDAIVATFRTPRIESVPSARVLAGVDECTAYFKDVRRSFPDQSFELITLHHADASVIAELWMSGTHLGEGHSLEPTGKKMHVRMVSIFQFDGADLVGQRIYYDAGTVARQLA